MPSDRQLSPLGRGLPEPLEALLLAADAVTRPAERLQHLCAALEALIKLLVGVAMADLTQACGAGEEQLAKQLDLLAKGNSDGVWLTTLQSLARELDGHPASWLGPRWHDLGQGGSAVVQALAAAVSKRNEFAHPKILDLLHNRKHAGELRAHLAEAIDQLPWLRDLAIVRPRDILPTVSGYEGALLVAGPTPERLDGHWTQKLLPEFLYVYDRGRQRLLCMHPWLIAAGQEMAAVQRALVLDDLRLWPKVSWKNAAIGGPGQPANVGQGKGAAAWLVSLVPREARGSAVELRQATGSFSRPVPPNAVPPPELRPARPVEPAQPQAREPHPQPAPQKPQPLPAQLAPARPQPAPPLPVHALPVHALPACTRCAGPLRRLQTGMREPVRGSVLWCPRCHCAFHAQQDPDALTPGTLLRRLWDPAQPQLLTTLQQAELLRPELGKSKPLTTNPHAFLRQGSGGAAAWLGRMDEGRWLVVAAPGVPLRDDHGACEAAQLGPGGRFALSGVEMVLARAP